MITLAPFGGSSPTPSISDPTAASHPSSCLSRAALEPVYQEFAWVASRVDMAPFDAREMGFGGGIGGVWRWRARRRPGLIYLTQWRGRGMLIKGYMLSIS